MGEGGLTPLGGLIRFLGGSNVQKILTPPPLGASATPMPIQPPKTTKNCPGTKFINFGLKSSFMYSKINKIIKFENIYHPALKFLKNFKICKFFLLRCPSAFDLKKKYEGSPLLRRSAWVIITTFYCESSHVCYQACKFIFGCQI